jgi:hypothetical protein
MLHGVCSPFIETTRQDCLLPENLLERDYDFALHRRMFEEASAA